MSSKRRRNIRAAQRQAQEAKAEKQGAMPLSLLAARDGYVNQAAFLGEASPLNESNDYQRNSITRDYELLTVLYRENWIAKRIIDTPCEDMTRAWYSVSSALDQDKIDELAELETKHSVKQEITNALRWARLYGGAAAVMVIKGQEDMLDQPLDYDDLMPGCFRGLIVVDRTSGLDPSLDLEEDMDDPEFGYPKYYTVRLNNETNETVRVHHSRLLMFRGRMLPITEEISESYWGASELEHVYEELQKRNATSANIAQLVFQANVGVLKMADFGEVMGMGTEKQKQQIVNSIHEENRFRTSFGMMIMGSEDGYEQHPYSFSGLSEIYESFMMDMAGAAEIPATKLYGRSPQGMNATGESDMKNYYEMLSQLQERNLRPAIDKLMPVMCMSLWGKIPDGVQRIVFEPLQVTTPAERSNIAQQITGTVIEAFNSGLISQKTALTEMRKNGKDIGIWTSLTDEIVEAADEEVDGGEMGGDPMGGMGGMMGGPMPEGPEAPEDEPGKEPGEGPEPEEKPNNIVKMPQKPQNPPRKPQVKPERASGGEGEEAMTEKLKALKGAKETEKQEDAVGAKETDSFWQNLKPNAEQRRMLARMKTDVAEAVAAGDLEEAKRIVRETRQRLEEDAEKAQKQPEKPRRSFLADVLTNLFRRNARDAEDDNWRTVNGAKVHFTDGSGGRVDKGPAALKGKTMAEVKSESRSNKKHSEGENFHAEPIVKSSNTSYNISEEAEKNKPASGKSVLGWKGLKAAMAIGGPKATKAYVDRYVAEHPEIEAEIPKYMDVRRKVENFLEDHPGVENYNTYDVNGNLKNVTSGYCVTFHQNNTETDPLGAYSDRDYAAMCAIAMKELGATGVNIGYFGNPEVSFECQDERAAKEFAIKHNQHSIYSASTGRTLLNKKYRQDLNPIRLE
ncbi:MAG: DUF1073 domain-containing protein [Clostridia bacterium]|nr:DUF1073 domain-containing protein [Clostridia bacterium]